MTSKEAIDILVDVYIDCSPCKHTPEQIKEAACLACQALEMMGQVDQITEGLETTEAPEFTCGDCGYETRYVAEHEYNYCPNCGRKVEEAK